MSMMWYWMSGTAFLFGFIFTVEIAYRIGNFIMDRIDNQ